MNKMVNRCIYLINVKFSQKIVFKLFRQHNKFVVFLWKGRTAKSLCTLFLFLKWLLICSLVHLHMSLYCCHIHAYTIFYFSFFLILYFLLNLMVQYFLLIPLYHTGSLLHWIHLSLLQTWIRLRKKWSAFSENEYKFYEQKIKKCGMFHINRATPTAIRLFRLDHYNKNSMQIFLYIWNAIIKRSNAEVNYLSTWKIMHHFAQLCR